MIGSEEKTVTAVSRVLKLPTISMPSASPRRRHRYRVNSPDGSRAPRCAARACSSRLDEDTLEDWEQRYKTSGRAHQLWDAHLSWRRRRNLPTDSGKGWPGIRYVVLHTLAHALIRELALECGYGASSIRERIYSTRPDVPEMAGVLLYTAAPDSEGTLGGLVSLGEPDHLGRLLSQALERARLCSADPLCSEHDPTTDGSVHHGACHACQFASETSCERGNRFLDRAALVDTFTCSGASLLPGP